MAGDLSLFWKIQFKRVSFDYSNYISLVNGIELVDSATKRRVDISMPLGKTQRMGKKQRSLGMLTTKEDKLLAKVVANRLKGVVGNVVFEFQMYWRGKANT